MEILHSKLSDKLHSTFSEENSENKLENENEIPYSKNNNIRKLKSKNSANDLKISEDVSQTRQLVKKHSNFAESKEELISKGIHQCIISMDEIINLIEEYGLTLIDLDHLCDDIHYKGIQIVDSKEEIKDSKELSDILELIDHI